LSLSRSENITDHKPLRVFHQLL